MCGGKTIMNMFLSHYNVETRKTTTVGWHVQEKDASGLIRRLGRVRMACRWELLVEGPAWTWPLTLSGWRNCTLTSALSDLSCVPLLLISILSSLILASNHTLKKRILMIPALWGNNSPWVFSCFCPIGVLRAKKLAPGLKHAWLATLKVESSREI